ncbi:MAG TPA: copper homeostasis protein CutC [Chitinophagaceae bacterium]|nr:copper homeostasis protein CutC [Chitinophagaceae bacterium]
MSYLIEIATSDYHSTECAVEGGADRIELCANLEEGGTTPSRGHIIKCREKFNVPLYVMIRPRGGDFLYSKDEFGIMAHDIQLCKEIGCEGIVAGMLNLDGTIDAVRMGDIVTQAYPMNVTFHRAFDRCRDPFEALEEIIELGCERILTSGQQRSALEGADRIAKLNQAAAGRIVIMPGSGVRKENIRALAQQTGCVEFHASLRARQKSLMEFIHPAFADSTETYFNATVDPEEVKALKAALTAA